MYREVGQINAVVEIIIYSMTVFAILLILIGTVMRIKKQVNIYNNKFIRFSYFYIDIVFTLLLPIVIFLILSVKIGIVLFLLTIVFLIFDTRKTVLKIKANE